MRSVGGCRPALEAAYPRVPFLWIDTEESEGDVFWLEAKPLGRGMEQRFTFDKAADLYGAVRPSYPDAVFDDIVNAADLGHDDVVLELGCGTGQATRGFLRQGFQVLALDPGADLLRVARESLASFQNVQFVHATFEDWAPQAAKFKLVAAAQAFHWIAPDVRFAKAASVLRPGGFLAVFGNVPVGLPPALLADVRQVYASHGYAADTLPEGWYLPAGPLTQLFAESKLFEAPTYRSYAWARSFTSQSYAGFLRTRSDHQLIEPTRREALIAEVAAAVQAHGDKFEMDYETHLYMARLTK